MNLSNIKANNTNNTIIKFSNRDLYEIYLKEIANYKPLTREEEVELFKKISINNDKEAIEKVWNSNLLFVVSVARRYASAIKSSIITVEDLITDGNIGLYDAIEKFDYTQGNKFLSFAVWHIRRRILEGINNNLKSIRVPNKIKTDINRLNKKFESIEQNNGYSTNMNEVLDKMVEDGYFNNFEEAYKYETLIEVNTFEKSLNDKTSVDSKIEISELLTDNTPSIIDVMESNEEILFVNRLLKQIPDNIRLYVKDYFGIDTDEPLNYSQIAKKYNKNLQTVRLLIQKHIVFLRRQQNRIKKKNVLRKK